MKKRYQKQPPSQIKKQSICHGCKWGEFYNSQVVWFYCTYPDAMQTEANEPMPSHARCDKRETG